MKTGGGWASSIATTRLAGCPTPTGSAFVGQASRGATANPELTFHQDRSVGLVLSERQAELKLESPHKGGAAVLGTSRTGDAAPIEPGGSDVTRVERWGGVDNLGLLV